MNPIKIPASKRLRSVLGLSFDGARLEGAVLRRSNGSAQVLKNFSVALSLDPLKDDPELMAREIRNHLDHAGIRERDCAVCLPLEWALFVHATLPDLPEEDLRSFIEIEAERSFPYNPETLAIACARSILPGGERHAGQIAIPREHVLRLERALRLARLNPVTFSLGISALQNPKAESSNGVLVLTPGERSVGLQVSCGGGVFALRTIEHGFELQAGAKHFLPDEIAREIRVTLGQLPASARASLRRVRIFGKDGDRLAAAIRPRAQALGLEVERVSTVGDLGIKLPSDQEPTPAVNLAAGFLASGTAPFEFLPPKLSVWQQFAQKHSAKKLVWAGTAAGAIAVLVVLAFLYQQWQLASLGSRWAQMRSKAQDLEAIQGQIRRFRPWFDESFRSLSIMRGVTEAFPESGVVTAKTLEIRNASMVYCTGVTQDQPALLAVLDKLRAANGIGKVTLDQVRGQNPMQFSFNFQWGGASSEN